MTKATITMRNYPAGSPAASVPYQVKLLSNPATILASGNTDANGQFTYQPNLSPGPYFWTITDTAPEPDVTRQGSSKSAGSGGAYSLYEVPYALRTLGRGIIRAYANEMVPSAGSGINFNVATGAALILGIPAVIYAPFTNVACLNTRDATNPRACYLVLQMQGLGVAGEGEATLFDVCGAAAASPVLPDLSASQTEAVWQEPLASFRLPPTGGGAVLTNFVDVRRFTGGYPQLSTVARVVGTVATNISSTTGADIVINSGTPALTLAAGITYDLVAQASFLLKAPAGQNVSLAVVLDGTVSAYVDSNISSDYVLVSNSFFKAGVVGTGVALTNAARVKVSAPTGQYLGGSILITATPRRL